MIPCTRMGCLFEFKDQMTDALPPNSSESVLPARTGSSKSARRLTFTNPSGRIASFESISFDRSILQRDPLDPKYNNDEGYKNSDKNAWKIPELPVPSPFPEGESRAESITRSLARFPSNKTDGDVNKPMGEAGLRKSA